MLSGSFSIGTFYGFILALFWTHFCPIYVEILPLNINNYLFISVKVALYHIIEEAFGTHQEHFEHFG